MCKHEDRLFPYNMSQMDDRWMTPQENSPSWITHPWKISPLPRKKNIEIGVNIVITFFLC